jgi:NAD+ diphosphatase
VSASSSRFVSGLEAPASNAEALWFAFRGDELLIRHDGGVARAPLAFALDELGLTARRTQVLGALDGVPCFSAELDPSAAAPEGHRFASLRALHGKMPPGELDVAGLAFQIQHWDRTHQVCGACGAALLLKAGERAKRCEPCALDFYPRVSPAIIVLVHDGPRLLMTRQPRFPPGLYGLVAGFLEPGETLERCVEREVAEETGLRVKGLRYFGSQPWPFPHQVMIGFFAELAGGELRVDTSELEDARWFHRDALPTLPPRISIARALVEAWLAGG